MTDIPEGRITATKLRADDLQIKLEEPHSVIESKPAETTNSLRVYQMNSRPQRILLWLMVIITLLNMCFFSSGIISTGAMMFANFTRVYYPPTIAVPH